VKTQVLIAGLALILTVAPAAAHPSCSSVDDLEVWSDSKADAGREALDNKQFRLAFTLFREAADALFECGDAIVDAHVNQGVSAGNNDPDELRRSISKMNYGDGAGYEYMRASQAAAGLHHAADCRAMVEREKRSYAKDPEGYASSDLANDYKACSK
jgi:hypothetical protein